jgi:hypothetical protein
MEKLIYFGIIGNPNLLRIFDIIWNSNGISGKSWDVSDSKKWKGWNEKNQKEICEFYDFPISKWIQLDKIQQVKIYAK